MMCKTRLEVIRGLASRGNGMRTIMTTPTRKRLKGIILDMDGTLCEPQNWMFSRMRAALGIQKSVDILEHIYSLAVGEQESAHEKIREIEREAMKKMKGLIPFMEYLAQKGIRKAICTRNFEQPVNYLLENFLSGHPFSMVIDRSFRPPKPSPAPILHIAAQWNAAVEELVMVGDSIDDMLSGRDAGSTTILLKNDHNQHVESEPCTDFAVADLKDIGPLIDREFDIIVAANEKQ